MAVTILETVSPADLTAYREYAGMIQGIEQCGDDSAMTPQDIRDFYIRYWGFVADLLDRHGIEGEEAEEAKISIWTGNIYVGSED